MQKRINQARLISVGCVLFPLGLVFSDIYKLCLYCIGLAVTECGAYDIIYPAGCALYALACGILFLLIIKEVRPAWHRACLPAVAILSFLILFAAGYLSGGVGEHRAYNIALFILRCAPAFMGGAGGALIYRYSAEGFTAIGERLAILALPAGIIYFTMAIFGCNPYTDGTYLGTINYMTFAYTLMPLLCCILLRLYENAPLTVRTIAGEYTVHHPQILRAVVILIFWVDIIASGTRGCYLAVIVFCIAAFLWRLISRRRALIGFAVSAIMAAVFIFNVFVWAPPGMQAAHRLNIFLDHMADGEFSTTDSEDPELSDMIDDAFYDALRGEVSDEIEIELDAGDRISDRGSIYKLAIAEFLHSPLTGMGQGEFQEKYGIYPHNIFLEMLCETGICGTLPMLLLLLLAAVGILRAARASRGGAEIALVFAAYLVRENISNSMWQSVPLPAALGWGLTLLTAQKCDMAASVPEKTEPPRSEEMAG